MRKSSYRWHKWVGVIAEKAIHLLQTVAGPLYKIRRMRGEPYLIDVATEQAVTINAEPAKRVVHYPANKPAAIRLRTDRPIGARRYRR